MIGSRPPSRHAPRAHAPRPSLSNVGVEALLLSGSLHVFFPTFPSAFRLDASPRLMFVSPGFQHRQDHRGALAQLVTGGRCRRAHSKIHRSPGEEERRPSGLQRRPGGMAARCGRQIRPRMESMVCGSSQRRTAGPVPGTMQDGPSPRGWAHCGQGKYQHQWRRPIRRPGQQRYEVSLTLLGCIRSKHTQALGAF